MEYKLNRAIFNIESKTHICFEIEKKKKLPFADSLKQGDKSMNYIIQPLIVFHI